MTDLYPTLRIQLKKVDIKDTTPIMIAPLLQPFAQKLHPGFGT